MHSLHPVKTFTGVAFQTSLASSMVVNFGDITFLGSISVFQEDFVKNPE